MTQSRAWGIHFLTHWPSFHCLILVLRSTKHQPSELQELSHKFQNTAVSLMATRGLLQNTSIPTDIHVKISKFTACLQPHFIHLDGRGWLGVWPLCLRSLHKQVPVAHQCLLGLTSTTTGVNELDIFTVFIPT